MQIVHPLQRYINFQPGNRILIFKLSVVILVYANICNLRYGPDSGESDGPLTRGVYPALFLLKVNEEEATSVYTVMKIDVKKC